MVNRSPSSGDSLKLAQTMPGNIGEPSPPRPRVHTNILIFHSLITLSNGLRALLISGETDKAAAALSVGIGHLSDPEDLPGLAHYTEHLLFLGSSRYPDEADYKRYLSANGGSTNAFTSMDETCYHFDCTPAGLAGALSRHSQFFVAPLFDPSCTEREVNAVDSEFKRNLQLDSRRLFQLGKATSAAAHPYRKFGTGSKETLWYQPRQRGEDGECGE